MNNQLFNSTFEMELRLLLLLSSNRKPTSIDWLINMDFIICYADKFQLPYVSLHGNNPRMYGELSNRRMLAQDAIKELVVKGLADAEIDNGYSYKITPEGRKYIKLLKSEYATQYKEIAKDAIKLFKECSDSDLGHVIQDNAIQTLKEGGR